MFRGRSIYAGQHLGTLNVGHDRQDSPRSVPGLASAPILPLWSACRRHHAALGRLRWDRGGRRTRALWEVGQLRNPGRGARAARGISSEKAGASMSLLTNAKHELKEVGLVTASFLFGFDITLTLRNLSLAAYSWRTGTMKPLCARRLWPAAQQKGNSLQ